MTDITILVNTCDKYASLWPVFFRFAETAGLLQRGLPVVLNNETKGWLQKPSGVVMASDLRGGGCYPITQWGEQLRKTLGAIVSEYVLVLQDDYLLNEGFPWSTFDFALAQLRKNHGLSCVHLSPYIPSTIPSTVATGALPVLRRGKYYLNAQVAVWRVKRLLEALRAAKDPWTWELYFHAINDIAGIAAVGDRPLLSYMALIKKGRIVQPSRAVLGEVLYEKLVSEFGVYQPTIFEKVRSMLGRLRQ